LPTPNDEYYDADADHDLISIDEFNKLDPADQLEFVEYHTEILKKYKEGLKKQNKGDEGTKHKNDGGVTEKPKEASKLTIRPI